MTYSVKEIYTIQGEGFNAGRAQYFVAAGCNLWSAERSHGGLPILRHGVFTLTELGAGNFSASGLADKAEEIWNKGSGGKDGRFIVCTGGEPLPSWMSHSSMSCMRGLLYRS